MQRLLDWVSDQRLLKTTDPFLQIYDGQTLKCVTSVYKGQRADWRGRKRMNAFGVHTNVQRTASCVSAVISAFLLCVCQGQSRAWLQSILESHGVCVHGCVCAHTEASLWTQAVVAFLPLGTLEAKSQGIWEMCEGAYLWLWTGEWEMVEWWGEGRNKKKFFCLLWPPAGSGKDGKWGVRG